MALCVLCIDVHYSISLSRAPSDLHQPPRANTHAFIRLIGFHGLCASVGGILGYMRTKQHVAL